MQKEAGYVSYYKGENGEKIRIRMREGRKAGKPLKLIKLNFNKAGLAASSFERPKDLRGDFVILIMARNTGKYNIV